MNKKTLAASIAGALIIFFAFYITSIDIERTEPEKEGEAEVTTYNEEKEESDEEGELSVGETSGTEGNIDEEIGETTIDDFIQCLKERGLVIYGEEWCPYCTQLAESLGGYETADPIYVECTEERERCNEEMLGGGVPEIQIKGEMYRGSRDPRKLAEETNCTYYQ